ncbi:MAG: endolytic transglycosylase MltG [Sphingomonas sp.]|nr:endolytic transglycosylase MltG [Sphingomonas sp.]
MKRALILLVILPALAIIGAGTAFWILWAGPGPFEEPRTIIVAQGASVARVAQQLESEGLIRGSSTIFRGFARIFGSAAPIQAGEFQLRERMSASAILTHLQYGRPIQRLVTIPEGMPSVLVHERLMQVPYLTGEIDVPREGSVLPDSYNYQRGETRAAVLARMQRAMRDTLARLWAERSADIAVASPEAAVILASVVEKETGKPSERRLIAGVYTNRIRRNMPLQADPTVIYPITRGRPLGRRILRSELNANNGYNTYRQAGLPIGPIANPGRESIAAVLNPERTSALFFVADGTGGHVFADTYEQHRANVERWYAIRRARGEM